MKKNDFVDNELKENSEVMFMRRVELYDEKNDGVGIIHEGTVGYVKEVRPNGVARVELRNEFEVDVACGLLLNMDDLTNEEIELVRDIEEMQTTMEELEKYLHNTEGGNDGRNRP